MSRFEDLKMFFLSKTQKKFIGKHLQIFKLINFQIIFCLYSCSTSTTPIPKTPTTTDSIPNAMQYLLFGSGKKSSTQSDTLSSKEIAQLQNGDILLRKGFGSISDYIADFLQEKYPVTHCGFVVIKGNQVFVLHTISNDSLNGMCLEPISDYLKQSQQNTLVAVRLKKIFSKTDEVLAKAQLLLQQKIPFDLAFDDYNASSLYCLEMVRNVLQEVYQEDLISKRTQKQTIDVLSMDNFFDSTYFEVVFNHFERNQE